MYRSNSCQNLLLNSIITSPRLAKSKNSRQEFHSQTYSDCYFNSKQQTVFKNIYFQDFYYYFRKLATVLSFEASYLETIYIASPKNTILIMGVIKYYDELEQYAIKLDIPQTKILELKENTLSIIDKIRNKVIIPDEINRFYHKYNSLYSHFIKYKNHEIINDVQAILVEINKVILPRNAQFSIPKISLLDLQNKTIFISNKSSYIYKDLHNFEEEPYIKEHMMLNLISSMWEVKNIVDLEDQECISALKKIKALDAFINLSLTLKKSKTLDESFKTNIIKFINLAVKILNHKDVMLQIITIKKNLL